MSMSWQHRCPTCGDLSLRLMGLWDRTKGDYWALSCTKGHPYKPITGREITITVEDGIERVETDRPPSEAD